jgi:hypothetical protein
MHRPPGPDFPRDWGDGSAASRRDEPLQEVAGSGKSGVPFKLPVDGYGGSKALESLSGIAAPLLAAASITVIGVIVQQPNSLAWPSFALALLTLAAMFLISAVQCGFWARRHALTPQEIAQWWPMMPDDARWHRVREVQWTIVVHYNRWSILARKTYGTGICFLWFGLAAALVPHPYQPARLIAASIAFVGGIGEVIWVLAAINHPTRGRNWLGLNRLTQALAKPIHVSPPEETWPYNPKRDPFKP